MSYNIHLRNEFTVSFVIKINGHGVDAASVQEFRELVRTAIARDALSTAQTIAPSVSVRTGRATPHTGSRINSIASREKDSSHKEYCHVCVASAVLAALSTFFNLESAWHRAFRLLLLLP